MRSKNNGHVAPRSSVVIHQRDPALGGPQLGDPRYCYLFRCRCLDAWVQGLEVSLFRNCLVLHHQEGFDDPSNARSSFRVTNVILDRAQEYLVFARRRRKRQTDTLIFYGVSNRSPYHKSCQPDEWMDWG